MELEECSEGGVMHRSDDLFFGFFAEFRKREQTVVATLNELQAQAQKVMDVISNPEVVAALRQDKLHNLTYLKDNHGVRWGFLFCAHREDLGAGN